jgi:NAD(P)H-hydrate epimerase
MKYITKKEVKLPKRDKDSHKGENGYVLVIGGSRDYVGAPFLAAKAIGALRSGSDLVAVAAPEKVAWAINCLSPDLVTYKLKGEDLGLNNYNEIIKLIDKFDVILIGNGIGLKASTKKLVDKLIKYINKSGKSLVIDADGLKIINLNKINNAVLTPHRRELDVLLKNSKIKNSNKSIQESINDNVILIKSKVDTIISRNKVIYNKTGNEGMTVGGTGDVLAGLVAGFVSQGMSLFDAACSAAYFNGIAGNKLKKKYGYSFIASDLLDEIRDMFGNNN